MILRPVCVRRVIHTAHIIIIIVFMSKLNVVRRYLRAWVDDFTRGTASTEAWPGRERKRTKTLVKRCSRYIYICTYLPIHTYISSRFELKRNGNLCTCFKQIHRSARSCEINLIGIIAGAACRKKRKNPAHQSDALCTRRKRRFFCVKRLNGHIKIK